MLFGEAFSFMAFYKKVSKSLAVSKHKAFSL